MASVISIKKGETSIAVGNLLGSNIFNILLVLGSTLLVSWSDLIATEQLVYDYAMVCFSSIIFIFIVALRQRVSRMNGTILLLIYSSYMVFRIQSG